ncbi:hypothetical protein MLD38_026899 [Melastoma candidum]|uniref:Uncharacterized protein n=1 Tax=Melastoma candidum TaxID=119954 RepID=A0ACB9P4W2_9MYRT|nr:hypothetical protein MLD38_026899 [Melastoma candidum]
MEAPDKKRAAGIALDFPAKDGDDPSSYSWPPRIPRRLRRRLQEYYSRSPSTAEDIEARLRDADLRRQQFYERLSSKARLKQRSPLRSSSQDEDLGQRLEAKLMAAQQKRLSILADAQLRLAKLDELRQAAKTGLEMRLEKEREKLGTKVETRIRQAQLNRMLLLRARKLRRATLRERSSQLMMRRVAKESKYKEHVHTRINQKRAAAEKKRLKLLEAERKRASARTLQVLRVANSISSQREIERKRIQEQLEDKLLRAKRQRAEFLRQRVRQRSSSSPRLNKRMIKQADLLSRKLARCWRSFRKTKRTTFDLAKAFKSLGINEKGVMVMPFEQLAILIESSGVLLTVKALLDRFESRVRASWSTAVTKQSFSLDNIDHLLKRVATPRKATRTPVRSKERKRGGTSREVARVGGGMSRYPVRIVLCAYMILGHPDAVLSGQGEREVALATSAKDFIRELELLIRIILDRPVKNSEVELDTAKSNRCTFHSQLSAFDRAWCAYLNNFVVWKVKDAKLLEDDLVKAACQLELSMIQTCKLTAEGGDTGSLTHDMKAIQKQVAEDQKLLREKVHHLSGDAGLERIESALSKTRSKYFQAKENGSPSSSPTVNLSSPSSSPTESPVISVMAKNAEKPSRVVRSLFKEDVSPLPNEFGSLSLNPDKAASADSLITENEVIVNGILHDPHFTLIEDIGSSKGHDRSIKEKVRQTMERAFWDGVIESMEGEEPQYDRVIELMKEVRDELCNIAPESWKEEINGAIDVDLLSQVLKSGSLDDNYLTRILEFVLVTLQKLSSPASEAKLKSSHQQLLRELVEICTAADARNNAHAVAMARGLRFVLEEIQALKLEISKARIQLIIPMLKGEAGFDYLRTAFANRCGPPADAMRRLPLTVEWLSTLKSGIDQEWNEHASSLSSLMSQEGVSHGSIPSNLRTGGNFVVNSKSSENPSGASSEYSAGSQVTECKGERVDLTARIGLLKLVCRVSALTQDTLPETFVLNLHRLRSVQAQMQKIVVIATSILICRQILLSERVATSTADMEGILSGCIQSLVDLLDKVQDVGIDEIVEALSDFPRNGEAVDPESRQSRQLIMARMLAKSLQAGDPVFERVSHAVYLAARAIILGGLSPATKKLAEMVLRPIGAVMLTERVAEAARGVAIAAAVSARVHEPWYTLIIDGVL